MLDQFRTDKFLVKMDPVHKIQVKFNRKFKASNAP